MDLFAQRAVFRTTLGYDYPVRIDRVLWSSRSVDHIARHEVTPGEVEDVLFSPPLDARRGK